MKESHYLVEASELREKRADEFEKLFHFGAFNDAIGRLFIVESRLQVLISVCDNDMLRGRKDSEAGGMVNVHPSIFSDGILCQMSISEESCMGVIHYLREKGYFVEVLRMGVNSFILRVTLEELN